MHARHHNYRTNPSPNPPTLLTLLFGTLYLYQESHHAVVPAAIPVNVPVIEGLVAVPAVVLTIVLAVVPVTAIEEVQRALQLFTVTAIEVQPVTVTVITGTVVAVTEVPVGIRFVLYHTLIFVLQCHPCIIL